MIRTILVATLFIVGASNVGCGPTADPNKPAPTAAGPTADTVDPKEAIGKCAADVKDGMVYGKIVSIDTDLQAGTKMVKIEGQGGATWNKNAKNIRVVDCK